MAVNPMELMKYKKRLDLFNQQHPKVQAFLAAVGAQGAVAGSVIELKVTRPDGHEMISNIKLTDDDIETINMLKNFRN